MSENSVAMSQKMS